MRVKTNIDRQRYYQRLSGVESSNSSTARPRDPETGELLSSAYGLYQFTEGTWNDMVKKMGLDYTLEDRADPQKSFIVLEQFTKDNEKYLEGFLGRKPSDGELYLAHFLGAGGAKKVLTSDANTDLSTLISEEAIKANQAVFGKNKTAKDLVEWADSKFGSQTDITSVRGDTTQQTENEIVIEDVSYVENLTNLQNPQQFFTFVPRYYKPEEEEDEEDDGETKKAKEEIDSKINEKRFLAQLIQSGAFNYQAPQRRTTASPFTQQVMQDGGSVKYQNKKFNNIVEKQKYWDGLQEKYGDSIKGRQVFLDYIIKPIPSINIEYKEEYAVDGSGNWYTQEDLIKGKTDIKDPQEFKKALSAFNPIKSKQEQTTLYDLLEGMDISTNDKLLLASSFLAEGGDKFIDWHGGVGEITKPISGFAYFGLDTIYDRVDEFIEKGYLDKDFKEGIIPERAKNEKGEEVMSARFVNYGDILKAKYAFHQSAKDALEKYIEKENIVLSNKAKDFFSSVGYISGEGNMKKMLQSYKKRGYLKDDKFLEKDFTPESWQKPHEYTMRKIKTSEMLKDEGFFNEQ